MRVLAVCLTTAALALVLVVPHARATSDEDSVTGHVEITSAIGNTVRYSINAIRHRDGSVSGEVQESAVTPTGELVRRGHGTVVCFTVTGNIARIGVVVDHSTLGTPPGTEAIFTVVDNGEGDNDPPDLASVAATSSLPDLAQRHCTTGIARPLFPVEAGNIQVRPSGL